MTRIRELRKAKGYTVEKLAQYLNVLPRTVGSWEYGNTVPTMLSQTKMAELFDVSIPYLMGREPNNLGR